MKKSALAGFKTLDKDSLKKIQGGEKYYIIIDGKVIEVEVGSLK